MRDDWRLYATPAERAEIEVLQNNKQRRAAEERADTPALRLIRERCYWRRRYAVKQQRDREADASSDREVRT